MANLPTWSNGLPHEWQTRAPRSVMGGVTPADKLLRPGASGVAQRSATIEFLKHLIRHAWRRQLVIWEGSPIHRRAEVTAFLGSSGGCGVRVERLPAYAPTCPLGSRGLSPAQECRDAQGNLPCLDLEDLHMELHLAIGRLRQKPCLVQSFFERAGLAIEKLSPLRNAQ